MEQILELADSIGQNSDEKPKESEQKQIAWSSLEQVRAYLNDKHAVISLGGKIVILNQGWDPIHERHQTTFSSVADFKNRYSNRSILVGDATKPKPIKVGDLWLNWVDRRQYEGVVFDPDKDHPGYYNLYKGLVVDPRPGDWQKFKDLIYDVIADGNRETGDYIIYWLADALQRPGGPRPGTAIALRGGQGIGKGTFATYAGKPFGQHSLTLADSDSLTGRFNNHLQDVIMVFADEAVWGGDKRAEGKLKSLITEPTIFIEPKGLNGFAVKNCVRLSMTTLMGPPMIAVMEPFLGGQKADLGPAQNYGFSPPFKMTFLG